MMRKSFVVLLVLAAFAAVPAWALAANVTITKAGFIPSNLTIKQGETVTWTNTDTAPHQVVSDKAGAASPILAMGQSYSFAFKADGNFSYKDALDKKFRGGTVTVTRTAAVAAAVTLSALPLQSIFGSSVVFSGTTSGKQAGDKVDVLAQLYGQPSFAVVATLTTVEGGAWRYLAKPSIQTGYQARWKSATSPSTTVGVRPAVSFRLITGGRWSSRVVASRSFAGRFIQLQRRTATGTWSTIKRVQLNASSAAIFRATLPRGTSSLRIAISVNQAGVGYLAGKSRTIVFHRA